MLKTRLEFVPALDGEFFAQLPAAPAVFELRGEDAGSEPYVTKTANSNAGCSAYLENLKNKANGSTCVTVSAGLSTPQPDQTSSQDFCFIELCGGPPVKDPTLTLLRFRFAPLVKLTSG